MFSSYQPLPAAPGFGESKILPECEASPFSRLVFQWLMPFLNVGYSRPLQKDDLWDFPKDLQTSSIANELESNFFQRCPPHQRPSFLRTDDSLSPPAFSDAGKDADLESLSEDANHGKRGGKRPVYDSSLPKALHQTFFYRWWLAGLLKFLSDTLRATTPLVAKILLAWLTKAYAYHNLTDSERAEASPSKKPQGVGYGIGLALALFVMQEAASLMMNHYFHIAMATGLFARTGVTGVIIRKSLRLSRRARLDHNAGQITNLISTDTARIDWFAVVGHALWTSPIQITIGAALLINNLGYSALVGLAALLLGLPLQIILVRVMYGQRKRCVEITDSRLQLTSEVLQGIRLIKYYAWEQFYMSQVSKLRAKEIHAIKATSIARSALIALVTFMPILASILSFIVYAVTGHDLSVPIVFSSLQLFNVIRAPLSFLPNVFSSLSDVLVAMKRISKFLMAEELAESIFIDHEAKNGVEAEGSFTWETTGQEFHAARNKFSHSRKHKWHFLKRHKTIDEMPLLLPLADPGDDVASETYESSALSSYEKPFELTDIVLRVPQGSYVAIVGRVGSGKSSLLQALIGEMRKVKGRVVFGGSVAYVPQTPWIRNATIRENIIFGQEVDEERFRAVVKACCLEHDFEMLPDGEETEIGEKGINLSGGQQARVSLARAAYSRSDVVLLDDSLSALDAYVGQSIVDKCILSGPLAGRTRILVTHALHVLEKTDHIYVMEHGAIVEHGTYDALMRDGGVFTHLVDEYGSHEHVEGNIARRKTRKGSMHPDAVDQPEEMKLHTTLIQAEERVTGTVSWTTYTKYFRFAGSIFWVPGIITLALLSQVASVGNNLFLGIWTSGGAPGFSQGDYMAVYASLGLAQAVFAFILSYALAFAGLTASLAMFKSSFQAVLRSPESFFDTTPIGRILSRLSKDQDVLDTELTTIMSQFLYSFGSVLGVVALVFYTFPSLGVIFLPLALLYYVVGIYYRRSSVETQRLDSLLRSSLYSSYSEILTGLSTIRAYGEQDRTIRNIENRLTWENRATYMTISIQQWLSTRLDFSGNVLVLGIALFSVGLRHSSDPSKVGVLLSYTLSITQLFSDMVSQYAKNEQNMNAVERVLAYTGLPPEGDAVTPSDPPPSWPEKGEIKFSNVDLAYRDGLPLVLKDVSFQVNPGEKVGIVGRTGAGKSSLLQALFRMVKLRDGDIIIDGYNISNVGLNVLRSSLALVPQDTTLFFGTLRDNLDPQRSRTDAELISVLQRAYLTPAGGSVDPVAEAKFGLDSVVSNEGLNYSAGERQLLALCRALVKNSRIIVLDEATSSVDVETDQKIQNTIQSEFASSTLLCIAHRLNTVACYDRVLVMDSGRIAEFDTVLALFDRQGSIFRSLCNEAGLSRQDILRIRSERAFLGHNSQDGTGAADGTY